ncbi:MAG: phage tail tape measure protein, partial [Clostridium sp.]
NNKEAKVKVKAEDQASSVIEKANNKLTSWLKAGTKKVISIALAGTLAMGGFGATTAIKTYSDFEKGLSNVKAVSQATDSEMKQLSNTAKSLGASTEWSAVQVTQAEELLGQAGFSTKENISALPGLLSLASAGDLDLAAATDIASGTLRSFNIDASNTSHVADVLALSASATNSDVTDLGETMKYVAPVSASLGISFEDTAAAAGLLSNQNIKGSQAGTVLRQAMARLASPTKEAAGLMKTYGINAFDTQGNMKPLSGVVDNLNSSLGKLTSQQRADIISTIFGTESMSGVLALMNQGGQSLSDLSKRLSDANGAAKDMANTKLDNLSGQWKILKSAVEGMNIALGERLAPYAKQFVTWFTGKIPDITDGIVNAVDYLSNHTEDIKETAIAIGTVVTAIAGFNIAG